MKVYEVFYKQGAIHWLKKILEMRENNMRWLIGSTMPFFFFLNLQMH